jgi:glycosyltransferase involved in cell wall biosynthesis
VIIPNGMDLNYWTRRSNNPHPNTLIFTGVMSYKPNEDAAIYLIDEILPLLRKSISNLEVYIVGRDPSAALLARKESNPEVKITGFVEDMRDYLERAAVFAAPVRFASGMQNKIQEALAMEVPVVTTSIVADGVRSEDGEDPPLYIADGEEEFAECVIKLLNDGSERVRLATEGRKFVERQYDWTRSAQKLEQMCFKALLEEK